MSTFSERFEQIREASGLKGSEFAEQLGIPYRSYMNYKGGRTPPADVLGKLVELFDVDPTWLMTGEGEAFEAENDLNRHSPEPMPSEPAIALSLFEHKEAESPQEMQMRMMRHVMDLHEENRALRKRIEELEYELVKARTRARRMMR
jgi:transcriptional regulator with XRE-family HTH domain